MTNLLCLQTKSIVIVSIASVIVFFILSFIVFKWFYNKHDFNLLTGVLRVVSGLTAIGLGGGLIVGLLTGGADWAIYTLGFVILGYLIYVFIWNIHEIGGAGVIAFFLEIIYTPLFFLLLIAWGILNVTGALVGEGVSRSYSSDDDEDYEEVVTRTYTYTYYDDPYTDTSYRDSSYRDNSYRDNSYKRKTRKRY